MKELTKTAVELINELELDNAEYYEGCIVIEEIVDNTRILFLVEDQYVIGYIRGNEWYIPTACSIEFMIELINLFNKNNWTCYSDLVFDSKEVFFEYICDNNCYWNDCIQTNVLVKNEDSEAVAICSMNDFESNNPYVFADISKDKELYTFYDTKEELFNNFNI